MTVEPGTSLDNSPLFYSYDGADWKPIANPGDLHVTTNYYITSVCWSGNAFVGVENRPEDDTEPIYIYLSLDGINWSDQSIPDTVGVNFDHTSPQDLASDGNGRVIMNTKGMIYYSSDHGASWLKAYNLNIDYRYTYDQKRMGLCDGDIRSVAWLGNRWVAMGLRSSESGLASIAYAKLGDEAAWYTDSPQRAINEVTVVAIASRTVTLPARTTIPVSTIIVQNQLKPFPYTGFNPNGIRYTDLYMDIPSTYTMNSYDQLMVLINRSSTNTQTAPIDVCFNDLNSTNTADGQKFSIKIKSDPSLGPLEMGYIAGTDFFISTNNNVLLDGYSTMNVYGEIPWDFSINPPSGSGYLKVFTYFEFTFVAPPNLPPDLMLTNLIGGPANSGGGVSQGIGNIP